MEIYSPDLCSYTTNCSSLESQKQDDNEIINGNDNVFPVAVQNLDYQVEPDGKKHYDSKKGKKDDAYIDFNKSLDLTDSQFSQIVRQLKRGYKVHVKTLEDLQTSMNKTARKQRCKPAIEIETKKNKKARHMRQDRILDRKYFNKDMSELTDNSSSNLMCPDIVAKQKLKEPCDYDDNDKNHGKHLHKNKGLYDESKVEHNYNDQLRQNSDKYHYDNSGESSKLPEPLEYHKHREKVHKKHYQDKTSENNDLYINDDSEKVHKKLCLDKTPENDDVYIVDDSGKVHKKLYSDKSPEMDDDYIVEDSHKVHKKLYLDKTHKHDDVNNVNVTDKYKVHKKLYQDKTRENDDVYITDDTEMVHKKLHLDKTPENDDFSIIDDYENRKRVSKAHTKKYPDNFSDDVDFNDKVNTYGKNQENTYREHLNETKNKYYDASKHKTYNQLKTTKYLDNYVDKTKRHEIDLYDNENLSFNKNGDRTYVKKKVQQQNNYEDHHNRNNYNTNHDSSPEAKVLQKLTTKDHYPSSSSEEQEQLLWTNMGDNNSGDSSTLVSSDGEYFDKPMDLSASNSGYLRAGSEELKPVVDNNECFDSNRGIFGDIDDGFAKFKDHKKTHSQKVSENITSLDNFVCVNGYFDDPGDEFDDFKSIKNYDKNEYCSVGKYRHFDSKKHKNTSKKDDKNIKSINELKTKSKNHADKLDENKSKRHHHDSPDRVEHKHKGQNKHNYYDDVYEQDQKPLEVVKRYEITSDEKLLEIPDDDRNNYVYQSIDSSKESSFATNPLMDDASTEQRTVDYG